MINLLPPKNKKDIRRLYYFRLSIVTLLLVLAGLFIGVIVLLPSLFLVEAKKSVVVDRLNVITDYISLTKNSSTGGVIQDIENKLNILSEKESEKLISLVIRSIISDKPKNIKITGFLYQPLGDEKRILLRGIAKSRDDLTGFARRLEGNTFFKEVVLPISNLTKNEDIPFSLSLILYQK